LLPYISVCLFAGLRPTEAKRLAWSQVNLADREIRLDSTQTKTRRPRLVTITDTLAAWLAGQEPKPFHPANFTKDMAAVQRAAGFGNPKENPALKRWTPDAMRHTAVSHLFRKTGSYGLTAEQAGNSEAVIKRFYQGRVSSEETAAFYALRPTTRTKKKAKK
jgi:integrase